MKPTAFILTILLLASCASHEKSDAYGSFEAVEVVVASEASGKLLSLNVVEGQKTEKDIYVGVVDTIDLHLKKEQVITQEKTLDARLLTIESQIRVLNQQKANLEIDIERLERLYEDGAATKKQMDDIYGQRDLLVQQIASTETQKVMVNADRKNLQVQLKQLDESLRRCYISNPISGTILKKYAEEGEIVTFGKPLYKVANLEYIDLKAYISGIQLPHIKLGQEVEVLIDEDRTTNRSLTGEVSWISSEAEFTPKTIQTKEERVNLVYAIKVKVKNDGFLKIGMPGEVNFRSSEF
jgi:HlyD family secretion protein